MTQQLQRPRFSNEPVACRQCDKVVKGEEVEQHTLDTGHEEFVHKPPSIGERK